LAEGCSTSCTCPFHPMVMHYQASHSSSDTASSGEDA
jgi:hypothetical protein